MVPTRDKRELLTKGKIVERWYLQETIENREGYYQRQERRELVPTRDKRKLKVFLLEVREKRDGSYQRQERGFRPETRDRVAKLKKCKSWKKIEKR